MIDELPPELSDLFAAERATPVVAPVAHAAARAKLAAALAKLAPLGHVAGLGVVGKALAVLAVVVGAGVATKMTGKVAPPDDGDHAAYFDPSMQTVAPVMTRTSGAGEVAAESHMSSPISSAPYPDGATVVADGKPPPVLSRSDRTISGSSVHTTARTLNRRASESAPAERSQSNSSKVVRQDSPESSSASRSTSIGSAVATTSTSSRDNASSPIGATDVPTVVAAPTEAQLLHAAWMAHDPARALALVHQDAQLHPDGPLAEERAAIEAIALANLHQVDDARAAATRFYSLYPNSTHRALVERAVERTP